MGAWITYVWEARTRIYRASCHVSRFAGGGCFHWRSSFCLAFIKELTSTIRKTKIDELIENIRH
jgi:hypothetical protein